MKKLLALLLVAVIMTSMLTACGHSHTEEILAAKEATCTEGGLTEGKQCSDCGEVLVAQESIPALGHTTETGTCERCQISFGNWYDDCYVDDFNQPTDEWFITNEALFPGTFSNSATTDSTLTGRILVDYAGDIAFFLFEYGNREVKNSSEMYVTPYTIVMRTPDGTDHNLTGTLYCGGDRIFIDDKYRSEVITALQGEGTILFRFVNAERTIESYLLTVETSNFAEVYSEKAG